MSYTIIRPADRQGWLAQREKGIGSSEVGTILGLNPFETPYQLWRRKKGLDAPIPENEAMRAGHILESAVARYFEEETGRQVIQSSAGDWLAVDDKRDYLRVSPDRTYWLSNRRAKDNKGILECKTTQFTIDEDDLPKHWFCQLMYQLGVMGYRQGSLAWLTRGRKFGYTDIKFDKELFGYMTEKIDKFWKDCIEGDMEPPVTTVEDVSLKFPRSTGKVVEVTDELLDKLNILKAIKPQIEELQSQKKEIEDMIKTYMLDADTLCMTGTDDVLVTYRSAKDSRKFNERLFAAEHPELYSQYITEVPGTRRMLVK